MIKHKVWQILYLWVRNMPICAMRSEVAQEPSRNWGREYYFFIWSLMWCWSCPCERQHRGEHFNYWFRETSSPPGALGDWISILGKDMCMQRYAEHLVDDQASTILMETSVLPFPTCASSPRDILTMLLHICQSDFVSGCNCLVSQNKRMTILSWWQ